MIEIKYGLFDKVVFFNGTTMKFEEDSVRDIRVMPTGISKDADGNDVLDGYEVLYQLQSGVVLTSKEVFDSEEQGRQCYREALGL
jgi:hypothetical protein